MSSTAHAESERRPSGSQRGHQVVGSDLSRSAIERARREASERHLSIEFHIADMSELNSIEESGLAAVVAADNALPHLLSDDRLYRTLATIASKLTDDGILLATKHFASRYRALQRTELTRCLGSLGLRRHRVAGTCRDVLLSADSGCQEAMRNSQVRPFADH